MADLSQVLRWNANFVRGLAQSVLERAKEIRGTLTPATKASSTEGAPPSSIRAAGASKKSSRKVSSAKKALKKVTKNKAATKRPKKNNG